MKRITMFALVAMCMMATSLVLAQEHYTEGLVRQVSWYRTKPGQFDEYMKYLRANFLPQQEEAKKEGLIAGYSVLINVPSNPEDFDVAIVTLHKSFGAALDYNEGDAQKMKAIAAKHYKTSDEQKQREMASKRLEMRDFRGTHYVREVTLKPMP